MFSRDNCTEISKSDQLDTFPPQGNDIGDVCDCEGNFDCDEDVDGSDATKFKWDFGRTTNMTLVLRRHFAMVISTVTMIAMVRTLSYSNMTSVEVHSIIPVLLV